MGATRKTASSSAEITKMTTPLIASISAEGGFAVVEDEPKSRLVPRLNASQGMRVAAAPTSICRSVQGVGVTEAAGATGAISLGWSLGWASGWLSSSERMPTAFPLHYHQALACQVATTCVSVRQHSLYARSGHSSPCVAQGLTL